MKYVIISQEEVASVNFSKVLENSVDTLRYNVEGTETVLKYSGSKPGFLYGKDTHTHSQILEIMNTDEWVIPIPESPPE